MTEEGAISVWQVESREDAEPPTMHRTAPHNKELSGPNVNTFALGHLLPSLTLGPGRFHSILHWVQESLLCELIFFKKVLRKVVDYFTVL